MYIFIYNLKKNQKEPKKDEGGGTEKYAYTRYMDYKFNVKIIPPAEFMLGDNVNVDHSTDTPIYTMLKTAISILLFYFFADIWRQIEKDETIYNCQSNPNRFAHHTQYGAGSISIHLSRNALQRANRLHDGLDVFHA